MGHLRSLTETLTPIILGMGDALTEVGGCHFVGRHLGWDNSWLAHADKSAFASGKFAGGCARIGE
jgi:hypothetical protein